MCIVCFKVSLCLSGRVALVAQRPIAIKLSRGRSVGLCARAPARLLVCPVHCGKTADRIRMLFGIIGRTGPGMRQVVGFGDWSTGRGTFGGEFGTRHCNQWGLYGVRARQCHDAALFPNYFGQTCYCSYSCIILKPFIHVCCVFLQQFNE